MHILDKRYIKEKSMSNVQLKTGMLYKEDGNILEAMRYLIAAAHNNNVQAQ